MEQLASDPIFSPQDLVPVKISIFGISGDGMTDRCQVSANLMASPGHQMNFKQGQIPPMVKRAIGGVYLLRSLGQVFFLFRDQNLIPADILIEVPVQLQLFCKASSDNCVIELDDAPVSELF